mgnify:CR=1 FL=1
MNKPHILMVEDDAAVGNLIATTLETQNYQFHRAKTGASALVDALSYRPDVMLLDLGLPDMDGVDIIKKVRTWSNTPIIVISARSEDHDKVEALDAGADDYVLKPFHMSELIARLRAVARRKGPIAGDVLRAGNISLNTVTHAVTVGGDVVTLSKREYALLAALLVRPGAVLSKRALEEKLYAPGDEPEGNAVEYLIHALRKKIGSDAIENIRGLGWRVREKAS